jgi:hypothetical protein
MRLSSVDGNFIEDISRNINIPKQNSTKKAIAIEIQRSYQKLLIYKKQNE